MKRRSQMPPQRYYASHKPLAIDPQAFLDFFMVPESRENEERGGVVIVDISGPLDQYDCGWCDSYESIRTRVQLACDSAATAIVLRVDSPGGDAAGCFSTAREVRAMCAAAGKPLWAYVEKACSAAYAFASAASHVCLSDTGIVGSIGVISARPDVSAMNAAMGLRMAFITSGARKADGNPDVPLSDAEMKATQEVVDSMAEVFFNLVAECRNTTPEAIAALQAGVFHGAAAIRAGLADDVMSFETMLAAIASGGKPMSAYDKARAALEEAAAGDDANAEAAKRALAAMDPVTEPDGDEPPAEDDKPKKKDGDEPGATSASDEPSTDDDDKPKGSTTASSDVALEALAELHRLKATREQEAIKAERRALLDTRPDFSPDLRAVLQTAPIDRVRKLVKELPKARVAKPAATAHVAGTRGMTQGGTPQGGPDTTPEAAPPSALTEMQRAMGMTTSELGCRREGTRLVFGIVERPYAAAAAQQGGAK